MVAACALVILSTGHVQIHKHFYHNSSITVSTTPRTIQKAASMEKKTEKYFKHYKIRTRVHYSGSRFTHFDLSNSSSSGGFVYTDQSKHWLKRWFDLYLIQRTIAVNVYKFPYVLPVQYSVFSRLDYF